MSKLISHEIKITAIDCRRSGKPDHFVQGDSAIDSAGLVTFLEMPVHVSVYQPENDGLVSDQSLIVAFTIADSLFITAPVGCLP